MTKIMRLLFTDEVAAKFSWTGQKENKEKFETLLLWKIIFGKNREITILVLYKCAEFQKIGYFIYEKYYFLKLLNYILLFIYFNYIN